MDRAKSNLILIADSTVLYSALVYGGPENRVLFSGRHVLVTTQSNASEVCRIITEKRGLSDSEALRLIESMPVLVVENSFIEGKWKEAQGMIGRRDPSDVPLVALALSLPGHDGIWSTDKDFEAVKGRFKVWRTREILPSKG